MGRAVPSIEERFDNILNQMTDHVEGLLSEKGWEERIDGSLEFKETGLSINQVSSNDLAIVYCWAGGRITYEGDVVNRLGSE